ncbi:MAG: L-threonylcarbamoyladenylate synthase [Pseudomonadota bacterium]
MRTDQIVESGPTGGMVTRIVRADVEDAADDVIHEVAAILRGGGLVAIPTETVYGLCAAAQSHRAVKAVFAAKGRPSHNPLIVHVSGLEMAGSIGELGPLGHALAARFWPGPLTLVARRRPHARVADEVTGGGTTVAIRLPASPLMRQIIDAAGPLVAPSANRSGRVSATSAAAVMDELGGRVPLILDGGPSPIGVESTVVDVTDAPRLLRPGAISPECVAAVVGPLAARGSVVEGPLRSPGLLSSHYAPRAALRLDVPAQDVRPDEGWLALGDAASAAGSARTVRLSMGCDLAEAARGLYAGLRMLDGTGVSVIAVSPIPAEGIGIAIRDRLLRAAAPRPVSASSTCGADTAAEPAAHEEATGP